MPEVFQKKTALVVSGGGSKGAFAVGAIEHLMKDRGLRFDIVAGTSTGALMSPLVVTGDVERLREIYTQVTTPDIVVPRPFAEAFLSHDALFDSAPAEALIARDLTEAKARQILDADIQMFITTVNLNTGKTVFFQTGPPAVNNDPPYRSRLVPLTRRDELMRAILASGSEPVFMPPIEVHPDPQSGAYAPCGDPGADLKPTDRYVDGGVRDIAPIKIAIDNRATDIYAIILSSRDRMRDDNPYTDLLQILTRTIGLFTQEVTFKDGLIATLFNQGAIYQKALVEKLRAFLTDSQIDEVFDAVADEDPFRGTQVVNLFIIRPEQDLPGSGLEFDPGVMAQRLLLGRQRAREVLDQGPNVLRVIA